MKILVVDDEQPSRDELNFLLQQHSQLQIVGEAENGQQALERADKLKPDVVFMDIEMPLMGGYEAAQKLLEREKSPLIVFATAYNTHAIEAFELGAVDYVLKPFEEARIASTVERLVKLKEKESGWAQAVEQVRHLLEPNKTKVHKIGLEKNGRISMISFTDIFYAEAQDKLVMVHTKEGQLIFHGTLGELENRLKDDSFLRVHRSFVVNLEQVTGVIPWFKGTYWLILNHREDMQVPVSKNMVKTIKELLNIA